MEGPVPKLILWGLGRPLCTWLPDFPSQLLPAASSRLEPTPTSQTEQDAPPCTLPWLLMLGRSARSVHTGVTEENREPIWNQSWAKAFSRVWQRGR